jgi:hypothetical protein
MELDLRVHHLVEDQEEELQRPAQRVQIAFLLVVLAARVVQHLQPAAAALEIQLDWVVLLQ